MHTLLDLQHLSYQDSYDLFQSFAKLDATKQATILGLLHAKKETHQEILGALNYFSQYTQIIAHHLDIIDIVGTGGDGAGTFNISTAASILVACATVPVAKHGGKRSSSQVGSQDVLQTLGIHMEQDAQAILNSLEKNNFAYLWAPLFNPAFINYGHLRQTLGFTTLFNILGPLLHPMRPKRQILGVYCSDLMQSMAKILQHQGVQHAFIVHGQDGLDEISITQASDLIEIKHGKIYSYAITPEQFGLNRANLTDIQGGNAEDNADIIRGIFTGDIQGPKKNIVILNAAAGYYIAGVVQDIQTGVELAKKNIENGLAYQKLQQLQRPL